DSDIVAQGEQLGAAFDRVLIYEDTYLRGRREGEITALFTQGMARTRRVKDIRSIKGGMLAIEIALSASQPGDLLVIQPDRIDHDLHLVPPSPMKYLNHSCEPNCGLLIRRGVEWLEIHALRDIVAGEELTLDYETFEEEFEAMTGPCLCQSPNCRGRLRGNAH